MGKITRNSAKKNEEVVLDNSDTESEYDSDETEEESSMDETSGDEDFINVSNIYLLLYMYTYNIIHMY